MEEKITNSLFDLLNVDVLCEDPLDTIKQFVDTTPQDDLYSYTDERKKIMKLYTCHGHGVFY